MSFDQDTPLNRVANETIKAHTALLDYFLMGAGRSQEKLQQEYSKTTVPKPPSVHLRTLAGWSVRYHWQARIAQQNENDNALALAQYRERHMGGDEALALISDIARGDMGDFADVLSLADLAKLDKSPLVKKATFHHSSNEDGTITGRLTIDLYDSQKALEMILKHHGSFEKDNVNQNINIDFASLSDEQLSRISKGESPMQVIASTVRDKINRALDSIAANTEASKNVNPQNKE